MIFHLRTRRHTRCSFGAADSSGCITTKKSAWIKQTSYLFSHRIAVQLYSEVSTLQLKQVSWLIDHRLTLLLIRWGHTMEYWVSLPKYSDRIVQDSDLIPSSNWLSPEALELVIWNNTDIIVALTKWNVNPFFFFRPEPIGIFNYIPYKPKGKYFLYL